MVSDDIFMYENTEIVSLMKKKWEGVIAPHEQEILEAWAMESPDNALILEKLGDDNLILEDLLQWMKLRESDGETNWTDRLQQNTLSKISGSKVAPTISQMQDQRRKRSVIVKMLPYAAVVIAIVFVTIFYLIPSSPKYTSVVLSDLMPGSNKAVITLPDGKIIELSDSREGVVMGDKITYEDGSVISDVKEGSLLQTVLQTPKGSSYQVTLSDGTKVWLNAGSKLTYPLRFGDSQRLVDLEGEAYFEVAKEMKNGKRVPFKVKTPRQEVEVLGTHFNVKAYTDEPAIQTTLAEGSIKVHALNLEILLKPGEQGLFNGLSLEKREVETDQFLAWKNDEFVFNETELKEALRTLSRWYDFEIVFDGSLPQTYLYGSISRKKGLSEVLKILEASGLEFRIEKSGTKNKLIIVR